MGAAYRPRELLGPAGTGVYRYRGLPALGLFGTKIRGFTSARFSRTGIYRPRSLPAAAGAAAPLRLPRERQGQPGISAAGEGVRHRWGRTGTGSGGWAGEAAPARTGKAPVSPVLGAGDHCGTGGTGEIGRAGTGTGRDGGEPQAPAQARSTGLGNLVKQDLGFGVHRLLTGTGAHQAGTWRTLNPTWTRGKDRRVRVTHWHAPAHADPSPSPVCPHGTLSLALPVPLGVAWWGSAVLDLRTHGQALSAAGSWHCRAGPWWLPAAVGLGWLPAAMLGSSEHPCT